MSKKNRAGITCVSGFVPDKRLTNTDLEKIVDTNDEWIRTRTGIEERRILEGEGLGTSDMCVPVVKDICKKHGISPLDIDCILVATITPDYFFPSTSNLVCHKTGAENAWGFDGLAACSGFLYLFFTAVCLVESGRVKNAIIIGSDKMSSIVDYTDRSNCILFGDAAAGVLIEPVEDGYGLIDSQLYSDGSGKDALILKSGGSVSPTTEETFRNREQYLYQDGKTVFKRAVISMADVTQEIAQRNNLTKDSIDWLIPHQANLRILTATADRIGLPMEKVTININKYGNTTAATIPLCLWEWEKKFKKGDNIILSSFGGGYTWGAQYLKWAY